MECSLKVALAELLCAEEQFWKLKSRKDWLTTTNLNIKHFHLSTLIRRHHNAIEFIKNDEGNWISSRNQIGDHILQYFQSMFSSTNPSLPDDLEGLIDPIITSDHNALLCFIPSDLEILDCIRDIGSFKSLGPNGMTGLFFKHYREIVGPEMSAMVTVFFNRGFLSSEVNHSHLILIPKLDAPSLISHYRPINLCNVTYKLIAKILAKRLSLVMSNIISPFQSAFLQGRLSQDNLVLTHEVFHLLRTKHLGRQFMAIKADIEKAYDWMEWKLILQALKCNGFNEIFINWISQCLSTMSYSILLNGSPYSFLKPTRGLRQSDLLSPLLFIIGLKVFSRMLTREEQLRRIHGIQLGRGVPTLSHLLFADDLLIFSRASREEAHVISACLNKYGNWSGQRLNP